MTSFSSIRADAHTFLSNIFASDPSASFDDEGFVSPVTPRGVAFLFSFCEHSSDRPEDTAPLAPTAVLRKEQKTILVWAFKEPVNPAKAHALADAIGLESQDVIPVPGVKDWRSIYCNGPAYTLKELATGYLTNDLSPAVTVASGAVDSVDDGEGHMLSADEALAIWEQNEAAKKAGKTALADQPVCGAHQAGERYGDAICKTAYNENDYLQNLAISEAGHSRSEDWKPKTQEIAAFNAKLCKHREGKKDGPAFVLGDIVPGRRLKNSVIALYGIGIDIDTGTPSATIDAALLKLGCLAVRYTTHSHNKTRTEIKKDNIVKYAAGRDIDDDLRREYLLKKELWDEGLVATVEYIRDDHTDAGIVSVFDHAPMPKNRVIIPLVVPYEIGKEGVTQAEAIKKWALVVEKTADLLGIPFDRACTDPSRLFYYPRHAKGKQFEISLFGGPLFDFHALELESDADRLVAEISTKGSKSVTAEGRALGRWSVKKAHGFQIADVITNHCPEHIRSGSGDKFEILCPFDDNHSNAGDQDDRACFVQNAASGMSEIFTISCRHETCRDKTNLDMLGKMVADGWFERSVLDDEQYNAILEDDIAEAKSSYQDAIGALTEDSSDEQVDATVKLVFMAKVSEPQVQAALQKIKGHTGLLIGRLRDKYNLLRREKRNADLVAGDSLSHVRAMQLSAEEQLIPTYKNCLKRLSESGIDFRFDQFAGQYLIETQIPELRAHGIELSDAHSRSLRTYFLLTTGFQFKLADIYEACLTLCELRRFNPVLDYLDGLKWDGIPRLGRWLSIYMGAEDSDYTGAVGKKWLVAGVRRIKYPGAKFDTAPIFIDKQGTGKSTALATLGGEYYSDADLGDVSNKDAPMKLRNAWIFEMGEMSVLTRQESESLKAFASRTHDEYRPPYGRAVVKVARHCVFAGTTNREAFLTDETGNRRWWPVKTGNIDLEALRRDRDQLWAEAAHLEAQGESIVLPPELWATAAEQQEARLIEHPWRQILVEYLEDKQTANCDGKVSTRELLSDALGLEPAQQNAAVAKKLREVMQSTQGWEHKRQLKIPGTEIDPKERNVAGYQQVQVAQKS